MPGSPVRGFETTGPGPVEANDPEPSGLTCAWNDPVETTVID